MTHIKICGLTNLGDARGAVEAGADWLGFVFYPGSPRRVEPEAVRDIVEIIKAAMPDTQCVGVFVDEPNEAVRQIMDYCRLDRVQLHGSEPPDEVSRFDGRAFKALRLRWSEEAEAALTMYAPQEPPPDLLLDSFHPRIPGGTGEVGDWSLVAEVAKQRRIILAGGLTPANVAAAIHQVRPWGVDVSSGVESFPGRKDHTAMRAFTAAVRAAADPDRTGPGRAQISRGD